MDFYHIRETEIKKGVIAISPQFLVQQSKDLMIRGGAFYAIFDKEKGLWSTNEYDVVRLVDEQLWKHKEELEKKTTANIIVNTMLSFGSSWKDFVSFCNNVADNAHDLDMTITFANTETTREDYISKRLDYPMEKGNYESWDEIVGTLYSPEQRRKIEWTMGAIITGDSKTIQKFLVFYGSAGTGKSTILEIIQTMFNGYYTTFEAAALTTSSNSFSTEVFKDNPLIAIQHDGDLSKIADNTKLNSVISHEYMTINEKYKASYMSKINAMLLLATNQPVKITDAKSGIIRRLIDVHPTGNLIPFRRYTTLMKQIHFEKGAIAQHVVDVYLGMGKEYYNEYKPEIMIKKTDRFYNFVMENFYIFKDQDGISTQQAYEMYIEYMDKSNYQFRHGYMEFREDLKDYFEEFHERTRTTHDGKQTRNYHKGFKTYLFTFEQIQEDEAEEPLSLVLDQTESIFDEVAFDRPAQYATSNDTPYKKWDDVTTTLQDLDTTKLHYVLLEEQHIVIDFDLKNKEGEKDLQLNMEAASSWPATYAEISRSGQGIHLHYIYEGDVNRLSRIYEEDIEVKVFAGKSSLRRQLTLCNNIKIASINSGLPLKGEEVMINKESVKSEKALRELVIRNLNKEIHPSTAPSVMFIHKILNDAYASGLVYDLESLRPAVLVFANNSTNQAEKCLGLVADMPFKSETESEAGDIDYSSDKLVFFDLEVYPNLFVVVWKFEGGDKVELINPDAQEIEKLFDLKLIGFNCRRYDNHILYARYLGYTLEQLYNLSQKIISNSKNAMFREAYNISYTDVYDFSSKKQSLAKFQIELGVVHDEMHLPWDEPVPEELWPRIVEYCGNDVDATEAVFHSRRADWIARLILSDLSGLTPNDSTQNHTAKIIFGNDPNPQRSFVYTDLSEMFPGYTYSFGKSMYKGEDPKEGGYVYAEPGMYQNVALIDVASMHPRSLIEMNVFGKYTKNFEDLVDARLAIKHKEFKLASQMMGGKLAPYLEDVSKIGELAYALKIVVNIVYGLTSARFDNKFKDPRNVDNIVAKRGALFMIDLKNAVQDQGYTVAHIKTDSIKIPEADKFIIDFVTDFGAKYGYTFEHETTFSKFALVNDSVYVGKDKNGWEAVGAEYGKDSNPYVYKTLFSGEPIEFEDLRETKSVTTALYLDMNENLPEGEHDRRFIGKVGQFSPILPGKGGGELLREKEGNYHAASGTKGFRWLESAMVKELGKEKDIHENYYKIKVDKALAKLAKFGDVEWFIGKE